MKFLPFFMCFVPFVAHAGLENCATRATVPDEPLSLPQVVDLGLCRNPQTAAAYLSAESARFSKNAGYSKYLPSVNVSAGGTLAKYAHDEWTETWAPTATLQASYLLFDFGKRLADVNALTATWRAAGFDYDESVQNYIYGIIGSYYALLNANADVTSAESLLTVAQTAKDTADKKFKAGVVAKADVLKADTTLATRKLELERAKNNREITKGTLLAKLSFPANQDIQITDMPAGFGGQSENTTVEDLINLAQKHRPDLLRAMANKDAAWHRRNSNLLSNLPSITLNGSLQHNIKDYYIDPDTHNQYKTGGSISVSVSMPIFAGFKNMYSLREAQAGYDRAIENERAINDSATLDVFSAYQNYKTAQTVLEQTKTLLASATESERVTAGMYKVGRATMLDWQTAQSELVSAQKQHNAAKYDLFTKRAAVALAVGEIKASLIDGGNNED